MRSCSLLMSNSGTALTPTGCPSQDYNTIIVSGLHRIKSMHKKFIKFHCGNFWIVPGESLTDSGAWAVAAELWARSFRAYVQAATNSRPCR